MSAALRNDHARRLGGRSRQAGISLFPAMMFLLVLTVPSIGALNSAMMEEKMVGNTKDTNVAFQMAEAALRDAEVDIAANITQTSVFSGPQACTPPSTWSSPTSTDLVLIDWSTGHAPIRRFAGAALRSLRNNLYMSSNSSRSFARRDGARAVGGDGLSDHVRTDRSIETRACCN
jgi:hypothetical protein